MSPVPLDPSFRQERRPSCLDRGMCTAECRHANATKKLLTRVVVGCRCRAEGLSISSVCDPRSLSACLSVSLSLSLSLSLCLSASLFLSLTFDPSRSLTLDSFLRFVSFVRSFVRSFLFSRRLFLSFVRSFVRSFLRLCVRRERRRPLQGRRSCRSIKPLDRCGNSNQTMSLSFHRDLSAFLLCAFPSFSFARGQFLLSLFLCRGIFETPLRNRCGTRSRLF